jgi:hypothetical protein
MSMPSDHRLGLSRRLPAVISAGALLAMGLTQALPVQRVAANAPVTGAAFTTVNESVDGTGHCQNGNPTVNCNIYDGKQYVWLDGGPATASVGDGTYFFAVLDPGGQADPNDGAPQNLSDAFDAYTNRTFSVSNGVVSYTGTHDLSGNEIRLADYADTSNPGGVYILAVCSLANGYPVAASSCKYDAFKVTSGTTQVAPGLPLSVEKDASGAYQDRFTWSIGKSVDKTVVHQVGGTATFNYTVSVAHDSGTVSGVTVSGTITVTDPNVDSGNATLPVDIAGVTDQLSDGTTCSVTGGGASTLTGFTTQFPYTCDLAALPTGELDNTVTVTWPGQFLSDGALLDAGSADFTFDGIGFTPTLVDGCANVTDSVQGSLGAVCSNDPSPTTFTYSRSIPVPQYGCLTYPNTATFSTSTTGATASASQSVQVCGPAHTGALTMGFWQNKNGQAIIAHGASTGGVCNSGTWLRQYAPFGDLSATASCSAVASYVTNVINVATCSGTAQPCNAMLKAQMLATALDVYFSSPSLGGNAIGAPAPIGGVAIALNPGSGLENWSPAFGGAPSMTVSQMLAYAASQSSTGGSTWYLNVKATQVLAKDAFDAINNQVAFAA